MTFLTWLTVLLAATLCGVTVLCLILNHLNQTRWMRIFSESQGIPATIMENRSIHKDAPAPKQDLRPRLQVPVPIGGVPRKTQ